MGAAKLSPGDHTAINQTIMLLGPRLRGPQPEQTPNLYMTVTRLCAGRKAIDHYSTEFSINPSYSNLIKAPTEL